jgi:RimJ/RimL family protein N-acetyltransferase
MKDAPLSIRPAAEADRALLFEWANDPEIRASSFTPDVISWETHRQWFAGVLSSSTRHLYVLQIGDCSAIGQARFDGDGSDAEISVSLAREWRGRGLGARVIRLATERAVEDHGFQTIHAYVKPDNDVSLKAFARAGYTERGLTERKGCEAVHLAAGAIRVQPQT